MFSLKIANQIINTNAGPYEYKPTPIYFGRGIMNENKSKNNLLDFKKIMDKNSLQFGLIYGTLLGAIREKKFISYDEDVDVFILGEDLNSFLMLLFELKKIGFEVARYKGDLLTIIKNDDYIDIYIFTKTKTNYRKSDNVKIKPDFLENLIGFKFYGFDFLIPKNYEEFLQLCYGDNWRTPIMKKHAALSTGKQSFNRKLARKLPKSINFLIAHLLLIYRG